MLMAWVAHGAMAPISTSILAAIVIAKLLFEFRFSLKDNRHWQQ